MRIDGADPDGPHLVWAGDLLNLTDLKHLQDLGRDGTRLTLSP